MKKTKILTIAGLVSITSLNAQSLYYVGQEATETIPLTWTVGSSLVYDDNVTPVVQEGNLGYQDEAWSITPYIQSNFTLVDPQTTMNFYARTGMTYFIDEMEAVGANQEIPNARLGFDFNHSVSERLRFSSRNLFSYELEPEFAIGVSNDRQIDPYFFYSTDNSVGYRWTERVGSYTGFGFNGFIGDVALADRKSWNVYHQMRYQYTQRTVLTSQYRFSEWTGDVNASTNHFVTAGLEYRLSENSIFIGSGGVQFRDVDGFGSSTGPFLEASVRTQMNSKFGVRAFTRYSMEDLDTVQLVDGNLFLFSEQQVFRFGTTGDYQLTPRVTGFGGADVVLTSFDGGRQISPPDATTSEGSNETLMNYFIGLRTQIADGLNTEFTINYMDSSSDFVINDYDRLRLGASLNYNF
ncbi:MAG: hypothetical protein RL117_421 [Verrucomicrobiota bacterium]|jgi:hypothetical protein